MSSIINNEVVKYINEKFSSLDLNTNQKAEILAEYLDSPKSFEEIKKSIDERYNELTNTNNNVSNDKLDKLITFTGINIYTKDNKVNDISAVVDLKNIDDLRNQLKTSSYYNKENDSVNFAKDGNDYGFNISLDDSTNVNISPILFSKSNSYLYQWNREDNTFSVSSAKIDKKDSYLKAENIDNKRIYTVNKDVVFNLISQKHISEMNNVDHDEVVKNSLVRYSYIAKEQNNKDLSDNKVNEAVERLQDKSYSEIDGLLKSSLFNKIHTKMKQAGFTNTLSLSIGIFCTILGFIICLIAIIMFV